MDTTEVTYEICRHCDHFVEPNDSVEIATRQSHAEYAAKYLHLDDGEKEHNHDAQPSGISMTLAQWRMRRPDLFFVHKDGIGPNSIHHTPQVMTDAEAISITTLLAELDGAGLVLTDDDLIREELLKLGLTGRSQIPFPTREELEKQVAEEAREQDDE